MAGSKVILSENNINALQTGINIGSEANFFIITNNMIDVESGGTGIVNNASENPYRLIANNVVG
ncbi:hypothetical protein FU659_08555 [Paenibacillus sp. N3.4]|nr:hypothetical protein FU659_08555 [Paenibacillus sp. N3.4]